MKHLYKFLFALAAASYPTLGALAKEAEDSSPIGDLQPRTSLVEMFSTELCFYCPRATYTISPLVDEYAPYVVKITHHIGSGEDHLTIDASRAIKWFYVRPTAVFAPAIMFDRVNLGEENGFFRDDDAMGAPTRSEIYNAFKVGPKRPAEMRMQLETAYDEAARKLTVKVSGEPQAEIDPQMTRLFVFVREDSIFTEAQAGSTGYYYHRDAVRACLTESLGDPVSPDGTFDAFYEYEVPESFNLDQTSVVAFVGRINQDDCLDNPVYQAAASKPMSQIVSSIQTTTSELSAPLAYYTIEGRRMPTLKYEDLPQGLYILKYQNGQSRKVTK